MWAFLSCLGTNLFVSQDLFYPFFLPGKFSLLLASIPVPVCTLAYAQVCQSVLTLICSLSLSPTLPPFPPPSLTFPSLLPFPACQCIASNEFFILDLICFHPHCSIFAYFVPVISLNLTFLRMISSSSYLPIFSALPLPSVWLASDTPFFVSPLTVDENYIELAWFEKKGI